MWPELYETLWLSPSVYKGLISTGCTVHFLRFVILIDFPLTVKVATLIFIFGRGSAISSAKEVKSSFIYNLVKS